MAEAQAAQNFKKRRPSSSYVYGHSHNKNRIQAPESRNATLRRNATATVKNSHGRLHSAVGGSTRYSRNQASLQAGPAGENIDQCFPTDMTALAHGGPKTVRKGFVKPMTFKFGSQFNNKSEEKRFNKMSDQVIKLRHLLINDPVNSHDYILKFLRQFFTLA